MPKAEGSCRKKDEWRLTKTTDLLGVIPSPALVIDTRTSVKAANATAFALLKGCERLSDLFTPPCAAQLAAALLATSATGVTQHGLELAITSGSGDIWLMASLAPYPQNGDLFLVTLTDVSALKNRLAVSEAAERRWHSALVGSFSGVWEYRADLDQWYCSDIWRQMRGIGPDEPIQTETDAWLERIHPEDRERVAHYVERQTAGDPDYMIFDYRERHRDGHYLWIECRGSCVERYPDGRPLRIIGTDIDITARKQTEERLTHLSRRLKVALEVSRVGVFEADFDLGTSDWDDGMFALYGVDRNEEVKIGGLWESMLHPDDRGRVFDEVERHVANLLPFSDEYRVILRDGSTHYIRSRTLPFIDSDGHRKMIGANWDVTGDVVLHRELERAKTLAEARNAELEAAKARIEHIALHDYLTDLPNRRYLDQMLDRLAADCDERGQGLAALHIDLDRFKQVNDTLGHNAGDQMLRHAARVLRDAVRHDGDFVARIGGDEFVFLAPCDGNEDALAAMAERLIAELRRPVIFEGHECRAGASIGIAIERSGRIDARQLLLNADIALYHAKNAGRNRYEFFCRDRRHQMVTAHRLADDLLRALENDEFVPHYQFQFCARSLDVVGAEALVRWQHPGRGLLAPAEFLAVAEEIGIVAQIDGLLLEKAVADAARWRAEGLHVPKVSVNVSTRRLHDPHLTQKLAALSFEPGSVSFELLESIFLDESDEQARANLAHIRKLGIGIEIDDFGTGHASIVSLLRIGPDSLKIDRELVRDVTRSPEQRRLVGSIIDIGRSLNVKIVAEGVETRDHVRVLAKLGCDVLQGYGLAKPMGMEETFAFLRAESWRAT